MGPSITILTPNSATEVPLTWDMSGATWDSDLTWDGSTYQANSAVPTITIQSGSIDIGVS